MGVSVGLTILDIAGRPVEAIPAGGGVAFIDEIRMNPAGTAAGAVMSAAKLGIACATVACLGNDERLGDLIIAFFLSAARHRLLDGAAQRCRADIGLMILPIRPNGERPALHSRGASDRLFVPEEQFDACATRASFITAARASSPPWTTGRARSCWRMRSGGI